LDETDSCSPSIWFEVADYIYNESEKISYKILTNDSGEFVITYWIEDIFGDSIKNKYNTTNTNKRTWTPDCDDGYVFILKAELYPSCDDSEISDNFAEQYVIINCGKIEQEEEECNEEIKIEDINVGSDGVVKFGEMFKVKLSITKCQTSKTAIEVFVEKSGEVVSEKTKLNMHKKDSEIEVTVPVLLKDNCDDDYDDGDYDLVVEGLGVSDIGEVTLEGTENCPKEKIIEKKCKPIEVKTKNKGKLPKIKSFYTLAKKHSDKIRLFANVDCPGNCSIYLKNKNNIIKNRKLSKYSGRVDFNVSYEDRYFLTLNDDDFSDNKTLGLNFTTTPKVTSEDTVEKNVEANNQESHSQNNKITSNVIKEPEVVYESSNEKTKSRIKYFIALVLLVFTGMLIWKRGSIFK